MSGIVVVIVVEVVVSNDLVAVATKVAVVTRVV